jgi:hypothetical protein
MQSIDANRGAMIVGYCREIVEWFSQVRKKFQGREIMLSEILRIGRRSHEIIGSGRNYSGAWAIEHVLAIGREIPLAWKFKSEGLAVKYVTWTDRYISKNFHECNINPDPPFYIKSDAGKCYKSLRAHLFKRYVRTHRCSYAYLKNMKREESLSLDADEICVVSLAFVIWRMSIEGLINVEGLSFANRRVFVLQLMRPDQHSDISLATQLHFSYLGFFAILHQLERLCGRKNFRVERTYLKRAEYLNWKYTDIKSDEINTSDLTVLRQFHVLVPESTKLSERGCAACENRKNGKDEIWNSDQINNSGESCLTHTEHNFRQCIFELRHPQKKHLMKHIFWHVNG